MGALKHWLTAVSLVIATPAHAESIDTWQPYIAEASLRFGVPVAWIEAVMQAESRGRTILNGRPIRSSAGAMGLMQLMPATWAEMRAQLGLGKDPDDPHDNILAGTFYLRLMYDRFGCPGLFAAYNAGPGRFADRVAGRRALPAETIAYLASVAPTATNAAPAKARQSAVVSIFMVRSDDRSEATVGAPVQPPSSLFVALRSGN